MTNCSVTLQFILSLCSLAFVAHAADASTKRPTDVRTHHMRVRSGADGDDDSGSIDEAQRVHVLGRSVAAEDIWMLDDFVLPPLSSSRESVVEKLGAQLRKTAKPNTPPAQLLQQVLSSNTIIPLLPNTFDETDDHTNV